GSPSYVTERRASRRRTAAVRGVEASASASRAGLVPGTNASASAFEDSGGILPRAPGSRSGATKTHGPSSVSLRYQRPESTIQQERSGSVRKTSLSELVIDSSSPATSADHRGGPSETTSSIGLVPTRIFGVRPSP